MLRKLSKEIASCYAHAEACKRKADSALTDERREDFLRLQQSWLTLARSYEFAERLLDFTNENKRNRNILQEATERVFDKHSKEKSNAPGSTSTH
jgi:hypothetical protein